MGLMARQIVGQWQASREPTLLRDRGDGRTVALSVARVVPLSAGRGRGVHAMAQAMSPGRLCERPARWWDGEDQDGQDRDGQDQDGRDRYGHGSTMWPAAATCLAWTAMVAQAMTQVRRKSGDTGRWAFPRSQLPAGRTLEKAHC